MNELKAVLVTAFAVFLVLFIFLLLNAIHFYRVHYGKLSEKIDGRTFDGGFLFAASRFMLWGHFCLSDRKAERSGVREIFSELSPRARWQLLFHWFGMMYGFLVLLGCGLFMLMEH